jgi:DNA-binding NtrC family response regulator
MTLCDSSSGAGLESRETVIVLENNSSGPQSVARLLQLAGYQVVEVASVMDGISLRNEVVSRAALVVAHDVIKGSSTKDLASVFRHRKPGIPVLYISSAQLATTIARRLDERTDFLVKPFDCQDLLRRVRRLIDD